MFFSTDKPQELLLIVKVVKLKLGLNIKDKALVCAFQSFSLFLMIHTKDLIGSSNIIGNSKFLASVN